MLDDSTMSKIRSHCPGYVWHWLYKEHGRPVMIVVRYDWKGEKTYRQLSCHEGEWVEGVTTTPYPLFGLDSLSYKSPLGSVIICEGEKMCKLTSSIKMERACYSSWSQKRLSF